MTDMTFLHFYLSCINKCLENTVTDQNISPIPSSQSRLTLVLCGECYLWNFEELNCLLVFNSHYYDLITAWC